MITSISSGSPYITVHGGSSSTPYVNMANSSAGMVRWNGHSNSLEIYDGSAWLIISQTHSNIGLSPEAESLLNWAKEKREQEKKIYELASNNEAVRIALDQLEQAKTRLELTAILARNDEKTTS